MSAAVVEIADLHASYGGRAVLKGISLTIPAGRVLAVVGPSGCGKTTLLRTINRLLPSDCRVSGSIVRADKDARRMDAVLLRRRVGMVFQKPNPFPMSIRENVLYGLKAQGRHRGRAGSVLLRPLRRIAQAVVRDGARVGSDPCDEHCGQRRGAEF